MMVYYVDFTLLCVHLCGRSAFDTEKKERVAVKKLTRAFESVELAKRSYREIKILKHMDHENVCTCDICIFTCVICCLRCLFALDAYSLWKHQYVHTSSVCQSVVSGVGSAWLHGIHCLKILTCSHPHMLTSSHAHMLTSSHPHMLTSSHAHILTCSHAYIRTCVGDRVARCIHVSQ